MGKAASGWVINALLSFRHHRKPHSKTVKILGSFSSSSFHRCARISVSDKVGDGGDIEEYSRISDGDKKKWA